MPLFNIGVLAFLLLSFVARAQTDGTSQPSSSDPSVHLQLKSYEKVNGAYVFQIYIEGLPANQQPKLKKIGEQLGWNNYIIGNFSLNIFKTTVGDAPPTAVDASTLELYNLKTGHKVVLTYHGPVQPSQ